jgi:hypothetical protein
MIDRTADDEWADAVLATGGITNARTAADHVRDQTRLLRILQDRLAQSQACALHPGEDPAALDNDEVTLTSRLWAHPSAKVRSLKSKV